MKIGLGNILTVLVLFGGSCFYFFMKSARNTKGLIINSIFTLDVAQANAFYFVMGMVCIVILILSSIAVYLQYSKG